MLKLISEHKIELPATRKEPQDIVQAIVTELNTLLGLAAWKKYRDGRDVAKAPAGVGISAAILKYRPPNPKSSDYPKLVPISDAGRALKVFRDKTGLARVGLVGFSAGSHLPTVACLFRVLTKIPVSPG